MHQDRIDEDQRCRDAGRADREDSRTKARVLSVVLSEYPRSLSRGDIERELLRAQPEFLERDELARAIRDLALAGLLHEVEHMVFPSRAALVFYSLELA